MGISNSDKTCDLIVIVVHCTYGAPVSFMLFLSLLLLSFV